MNHSNETIHAFTLEKYKNEKWESTVWKKINEKIPMTENIVQWNM